MFSNDIEICYDFTTFFYLFWFIYPLTFCTAYKVCYRNGICIETRVYVYSYILNACECTVVFKTAFSLNKLF